jgi:hypothetical protein
MGPGSSIGFGTGGGGGGGGERIEFPLPSPPKLVTSNEKNQGNRKYNTSNGGVVGVVGNGSGNNNRTGRNTTLNNGHQIHRGGGRKSTVNNRRRASRSNTDEIVAGIDEWAQHQVEQNHTNDAVQNNISDINDKLLESTPEMIEARRLDALAAKGRPKYQMTKVETGLFSSTLVLRATNDSEGNRDA